MFALKNLGPHVRAAVRVPRHAVAFQQKRGMAGGDDIDDSMFVNWWDNPMNPDAWHKHHLAWWGVAFWGVVFYAAFGGKKEAAPAADAAAPAAATH